jgi:hypothetical protein
MTGFLQQIQFTSFPNAEVQKVFENAGLQLSYGGFSWTLMGDNTLPATSGMAYVNLGKPLGYFFTKTSQDEILVDDSILLRKQNKESISQNKVLGYGLPLPKCVNVVGVAFQETDGNARMLKQLKVAKARRGRK